jgi:hypothetical protein
MIFSNGDEYDSSSESDTEIIKISSLKKFISIKNNNIVLNNELMKINKPIKIVSFLGNARIGKSTLMNCYISNKMNENMKIFNTSKSLEKHCTSGIDMLCIEMSEYNLYLLDVQGLDLNDSKDDCKLMLFIYMISNLIIFNPKTILDNTVLSSLQSLTSIITYMPNIESKTTKPSLLFRPRDIDQESDYDSGKNLKDMLCLSITDQFTNVRESIKKLFTNIECNPTFYLDKKEKALLSKDKFVDFMDDTSNGFKDFCYFLDQMIEYISEHPSENFNKRIANLIDSINTNENIDYTKFDITMREADLYIREWIIKNIDRTKYDVIINTYGTQQEYERIIKPRMDYRDLIRNEFDKRFEKTTPKIRDKFRQQILSTFNKHIDKVYNEAIEISTIALNDIYDTKIFTFNKVTDFIKLGIRINDQVKHIYEEMYEFIRKSNYLECVKDKFIVKTQVFIDSIDKQVIKIYNEIKSDFSKYIDRQITSIITFMNHQKTLLLNTHINDIKQNFEMIISNINKLWIDNIYDKIEYPKTKIIIKNTPSKAIVQNDIFNNFDKSDLYKHIYLFPQLKEFKSEDSNLISIVKDYLEQFEDEFNTSRIKKLPSILRGIQMTKINMPTDYLSIKKMYAENLELYRSIKCDNINCLDLFIFGNIQTLGILEGTSKETLLIMSKYAFIVNKLEIHKIYIKKEFDEKYKDILPYLQQMTSDIYLNYNITLVIIDILFKKALLL